VSTRHGPDLAAYSQRLKARHGFEFVSPD
jgi:hypothetical protein